MKYLILILFITSCAHRSSLKDVNSTLYEMAQSQLNSLPDNIWPGFKAYKPLVIYNTIEGQYLFGSEKYPVMGYKKYSTTHKHPLGEQFQERVYNEAFSKELFQKYYPVLTNSVFMIDSLERMNSLGRKWNAYDWATIYIHEIFHLHQGTLWSKELIDKPENIDSEILQKLKNDQYNIDLLVKEQRIIRTALLKLDFKNIKNVKKACSNLRKQRNIRYKYIKKKFSKSKENDKVINPVMNEQFYETMEGTARYIEKYIDLYSKNNPTIRNFINNDLLSYLDKYGIKTYYYMLHQIELGENYYYETGLALSLLLDKLNPNWKVKAFKTSLWDQVEVACSLQ